MAIDRLKQFNQRGFTLIEVLFSLSICLLIILNSLPILKVVSAKDKLDIISSSHVIGVNQLTRILFTAKDIEVSDRLSYKNEKDEQFTISLNNNRVVKEPGFDIIIRDVDSLSFVQQAKNIYMTITVNGQEYTYLIATNYQINDIKDEENEVPVES